MGPAQTQSSGYSGGSADRQRQPQLSTRIRTMPPRRSSHLKHVPLQHTSVLESMESKLKRLRPAVAMEHSEATSSAASGPDGTQVASGSRTHQPVQNKFTRPAVPVVRNVRRGSATEALASFHELGENTSVKAHQSGQSREMASVSS